MLMYVEMSTERLNLRPLCEADLNAVYEYACNADNARYMLFYPKKSKEDLRQFLKAVEEEWKKEFPVFCEFAVILDNVIIGNFSIDFNEDRTECELGWIVDKHYWGNGYATEAALALKKYVIQSGVQKLTACCDYRNAASARVMEKAGLILESEGMRTYADTKESAKELMFSLNIADGKKKTDGSMEKI